MKLYTLQTEPNLPQIALLKRGVRLEPLLYKHEERFGLIIQGPSSQHNITPVWTDDELNNIITKARPFSQPAPGNKTGTRTFWLQYANLDSDNWFMLDDAAATTDALVLLLESPGFRLSLNGVATTIAEVRWGEAGGVYHSRLLQVQRGTVITAPRQQYLWNGNNLATTSPNALNKFRRENVGYPQ